MRDSGGQRPHRGHSTTDHELGLQLLAFGHVPNDSQGARMAALPVDQEVHPDLDVDLGAELVPSGRVEGLLDQAPGLRGLDG